MITFEKTGLENTTETLKLALAAAKEKELDIVVATSTGDTVFQLLELAKEMDYTGNVVAVTHVYGMKEKGTNDCPVEAFAKMRENGVRIVTAAHALSGAERGLSSKFHGVYPVEIVAGALRMLGQGTKVCVEVALMANDSGNITYGKPVVAVGGSSHGADTACIITPGYTASLLDTKIHEIICKPGLY